MKTINCVLFFFTVLTADVSHAAIVNLTRDLGQRVLDSSPLISAGLGGYGNLNSLAKSYTISADTVADTGSFTDIKFGVAVAGGGTKTSTVTTVTPPTDFPNLPIITTTTFTETVKFDPISPADLAPQLLSSTVGPITYVRQDLYRFPTTVMIHFPDSFRVSGTYELHGPTQSVTLPFSVVYNRSGGANLTRSWGGFVGVGNNFPNTARIAAFAPFASANYTPATPTVFNGMLDGQTFNVRLLNTTIFASLPLPEPTSICLAAFGVAGISGARAGRKRLKEAAL